MAMASRKPYVFAIVIAAGLGATTLGACGVKSETTRDSADVAGRIASVKLDNAAGSVTLHGAKGTDKVTVKRTIKYRDDKPEGRSFALTDGVLTLRGCGKNCTVDYTVDLPAGLTVEGRNTSGAVHLSGMGRIAVTTSSGGIELNGASGPVEVRTGDGDIDGTGLTGGKITARTGNGTIDLTTTKPSDVKAGSANGSITLTVPKDGYHLSAKTDNGSKSIGVANDPSADHRLEVSTSNGDIAVKGA